MRRNYLYVIVSCLILFYIGCATTPSYEKPRGDYVWPPPPATPKIKWLTQWSNRYDFGAPSKLLTTLIGQERVEVLNRPNGVVADSAGNVFVADSGSHIIFVFDIEKNVLRFLGLGTLATPIGLAIDNKRGILYVSDSKFDKVFGLDKDTGKVVMSMGAPGEFHNPSGMVYDEERERLYVSDTGNHIVRVFDKNGNPLSKIGKRGVGNGEFNFPSYLALGRNGRLYVDDSFNFRIQVLDSEGNFLKAFGKVGDTSGFFNRPNGIGVDSDGHIYVVDASFCNFQIFDEDGKLLLWVGNSGRNIGEFYLPSGMYIDREDRIYISDTFNGRVQVFQYMKEGK